MNVIWLLLFIQLQLSCCFNLQSNLALFFKAKNLRDSGRVSQVVMMSQGSKLQFENCPRVGLGLAALGRPGYINVGRSEDLGHSEVRSVDNMRQICYSALDAAWASGIRYFDVARSYGKSEEFLAGWLQARGIPSSQVVVGSKWGYRYTADWQIDTKGAPHEIKDHSATHFVSQSAESLTLLGEYLQLYQIHSATLESGVLTDELVLNELRALKKRGVRIGLSLSGVRQGETLRTALQIPYEKGVALSSTNRLFDSVQATWNLLEQSAGPALVEAREAGLRVIVKEGMANGRLLASGVRGDSVRDAARRLGCAPDALCLAAALAQPFAPLVLSGAATAEQVRSNAAAAAVAEELLQGGGSSAGGGAGADILRGLAAQLRMDPQVYWEERSAMAWN